MTKLLRVLAFVLVPLVPVCTAHAQLTIPWSTLDSGGGALSGGTFTLHASIAQPDATANAALAGAAFTITGGFWMSAESAGCPSDFDNSGGVDVVDLFGFLDAWFSQSGGPPPAPPAPSADFDLDNDVDVVDLFDFLDAWFAENGVCS